MSVDERTTGVETPPTWVPVERRWLGLDRRSLLPAFVIMGIALLFAGILPAINNAVAYRDEVRAGEVVTLGKGITFVPAPGWQLASGVRVGEETISGVAPPANITRESVSITVQVIATADDAGTILGNFEQISGQSDTPPDFAIIGGRHAITSDSGVTGLLEQYGGAGVSGLIAVYTFDARDVAVAYTVKGPESDLDAVGAQIGRMLASLAREEGQ